jgi:hypothetical protein
MKTNKQDELVKIGIGDIVIRLLIFGLIWIGAFHLYTTIFDTNWPLWADVLGSFFVPFLFMVNKSFNFWFWMEVEK